MIYLSSPTSQNSGTVTPFQVILQLLITVKIEQEEKKLPPHQNSDMDPPTLVGNHCILLTTHQLELSIMAISNQLVLLMTPYHYYLVGIQLPTRQLDSSVFLHAELYHCHQKKHYILGENQSHLQLIHYFIYLPNTRETSCTIGSTMKWIRLIGIPKFGGPTLTKKLKCPLPTHCYTNVKIVISDILCTHITNSSLKKRPCSILLYCHHHSD